jgi:hypothetical protein
MPPQRVRVMLSSRNRYLIPAPGTGPEVGPGFTLYPTTWDRFRRGRHRVEISLLRS